MRKKLNKICSQIEENRIRLYFPDIDNYFLTKKYGNRFNAKEYKDSDVTYYAEYKMDNENDNECCGLYCIEFGGYGVYSCFLCKISIYDFSKFVDNFHYSSGMFRRNNVVNY